LTGGRALPKIRLGAQLNSLAKPSLETIESELELILNRVLRLSDFRYQDDLTSQQIPNWDSLAHIQIAADIETKFNIRLTRRDLRSIANIGDYKRLISAKTMSDRAEPE